MPQRHRILINTMNLQSIARICLIARDRLRVEGVDPAPVWNISAGHSGFPYSIELEFEANLPFIQFNVRDAPGRPSDTFGYHFEVSPIVNVISPVLGKDEYVFITVFVDGVIARCISFDDNGTFNDLYPAIDYDELVCNLKWKRKAENALLFFRDAECMQDAS